MKKKFLFLLLLFWVASNLSYAQDEDIYGKNSYIPVFADADTVSVYIACWEGPFVYEMHMGKDSIFLSSGYYYRVFEGYIGVREDTIAHKIYTVSGENDVIMYDFTLEVGDEAWSREEYIGTVCEIDYLYIAGQYRKTMYITGTGAIWVEGIGSIAGFDRPDNTGLLYGIGDFALTCFYKDNELVYEHPMTIEHDCYWTKVHYSIEDNSVNLNVKLQPNPVTGVSELNFLNTQAQKVKLMVYNLQGLLVYSETTQSDKFSINKNNFVTGMYLYRLLFEDGNSASGKFIVE